jgi:hypothetical protein
MVSGGRILVSLNAEWQRVRFLPASFFQPNKNEGYLVRGAGGLPRGGISQIRFNPESNRRAVARMARRTIPQRERQPVRRVSLLERRQVELELQLARQRLELQQPGRVARKSHRSPVSRRAIARVAADSKEQRVASYVGMLKHGNAEKIKRIITTIADARDIKIPG